MEFWNALPGWQVGLLLAYAIVILAAMWRHVLVSQIVRIAPALHPNSDKLDRSGVPLISIMVPAKDEEDTIEHCLRSLLAQDYRNFEVLVVDDRSTDRTSEIVERLAQEDSRLRLIRNQTLPQGWTGKNYALHLCQQSAQGDWLLFVDADTHQHPSCLSVVMHECQRHRADVLSLLPALECRSFWEAVIQPYAATCLMTLFPLTKVNDPAQRNHGFANGQFIMIHRDAYDRIGGHKAVRHKFVEDIELGRLAARSGLNLRVSFGASLSKVRMYTSLKEIVRGWGRIFYSAVDARATKVSLVMAVVALLSLFPYLVLLAGGATWFAGGASAFVKVLVLMAAAHEAGQLALWVRCYRTTASPIRFLALRMLSVLMVLYILAHTLRMCRTRRVIWRGTSYGREMAQAPVSAAMR